MSTLQPSQFIFITLALTFSALFSGIEAAFLNADKLGMELAQSPKSLVGRLLADFAKHPTRFITTTLIGNTISLVIYSACMSEALDKLIRSYMPYLRHRHTLSLGLQTIITTLVVLVVAEFIPKRVFLRYPYRLLKFFAIPMAVVAHILWPLVAIATRVTKVFITHVLRHTYQETRPSFGVLDLYSFIKNIRHAHEKMPGQVSTRIVSNLLEFKKARVRDCMVPRAEIIAINHEDGIPALKNAAMHSKHSKILVYCNYIDDIIGYCHAKELFKNPPTIDSILTPIMVVSETNLASEVMIKLINAYKSLALVVDEFGGVAGMVSVEDFVEKIVGDIQDEHDTAMLLVQQLGPNAYLLSARHEIGYLNEKYGWDIPPGAYDTLGGFIISVTERLPELHETINIPPFTFNITSMKGARIDTVKLFIDGRKASL
ncbi:MAG: hemolysin family protein [Bacteroidota bacterium]